MMFKVSQTVSLESRNHAVSFKEGSPKQVGAWYIVQLLIYVCFLCMGEQYACAGFLMWGVACRHRKKVLFEHKTFPFLLQLSCVGREMIEQLLSY